MGFGIAVGSIGSDVEAVLSDTAGAADVGVLAGGKVCPLSQAAKAISKAKITRADPAAAVRSRNFISSSRICYSRKSITPRPSKGRAAVVWQENRDPLRTAGGSTVRRVRGGGEGRRVSSAGPPPGSPPQERTQRQYQGGQHKPAGAAVDKDLVNSRKAAEGGRPHCH